MTHTLPERRHVYTEQLHLEMNNRTEEDYECQDQLEANLELDNGAEKMRPQLREHLFFSSGALSQ